MNRQYISRFVFGVACLGMGSAVFADDLLKPIKSTTDWMTHPWMDMESKHKCYKVEDMNTGRMMYLDRVGHGVSVISHGQMTNNLDDLVGWKITCLKTGKTGIITGVKHRGLRDVKSSDKHMTRYEYVVFKVKHVHYDK
ncbi:MAG: hypothetical protein EBQ95_06405 [Gammaproteobacteria bacterium]|nr:hypothetical protein [Gammaproteobacteria bacterium]